MNSRQLAWNLLIFLPATVAALPAADDPARGDEAQESERELRLESMRRRAELAQVYSNEGGESVPASLLPNPIMRYSDLPRRFDDATLWIWTSDELPVAVCKIEDHRPSDDKRVWVTCLASLSAGTIDVEWTSGRRWSATRPGIEFQAISDAPGPAASKQLRTLQFKALARRFSATMTRNDDAQRMRLLSRPLYRYDSPGSGLVDAAIFVFAANGTNPDFLLVLELRRDSDSGASWRYGIAPVTADALEVSLDGKPIWRKEYTANPRQPTFTFFFEPNEHQ